ncbi:MAG: C39 family peptidase [Beduini sp.]|uniref:C39 family peptidase n=1 Tax=Beduini sp. TaxID=1922300 RepID=UPI0039A2AD3E
MSKRAVKRLLLVIVVFGIIIGGSAYLLQSGIFMKQKKSFGLTDPLAIQLNELYPDNEKVQEIIYNLKNYPRALVSVLLVYEEEIDYVYNYPNRQHFDDIVLTEQDFKREVPLFIQWDSRWGYDYYADEMMGLNACGPTSLAMVISALTGNRDINPRSVAQFAYDNGYYVQDVGTMWTLMSEGASAFGVQGTQLPGNAQSILNALNQGHLVILSVGPGDFTPSGHFIVLTGIDEKGQIILNDPNSPKRSDLHWDIQRLVDQTAGAWEFTKL